MCFKIYKLGKDDNAVFLVFLLNGPLACKGEYSKTEGVESTDFSPNKKSEGDGNKIIYDIFSRWSDYSKSKTIVCSKFFCQLCKKCPIRKTTKNKMTLQLLQGPI